MGRKKREYWRERDHQQFWLWWFLSELWDWVTWWR